MRQGCKRVLIDSSPPREGPLQQPPEEQQLVEQQPGATTRPRKVYVFLFVYGFTRTISFRSLVCGRFCVLCILCIVCSCPRPCLYVCLWAYLECVCVCVCVCPFDVCVYSVVVWLIDCLLFHLLVA